MLHSTSILRAYVAMCELGIRHLFIETDSVQPTVDGGDMVLNVKESICYLKMEQHCMLDRS